MASTGATATARPAVHALALTVGALGVVFGDIGTSPLYALQIVYSLDGGVVRPTAAASTASSRWSSGRSR
jgi:KUP system potassium uptake protein